jgi:hypothetical protein
MQNEKSLFVLLAGLQILLILEGKIRGKYTKSSSAFTYKTVTKLKISELVQK